MGRALSPRPRLLRPSTLRSAAAALGEADQRLGLLLAQNQTPPMWGREPGFATLVKIVLEQQVSLDSAAAAFANLKTAIRSIEPDRFLTLDDAELKTIGFSRQKSGYCRGIATEVIAGSLDLEALSALGDRAARDRLTAIRGIGPWTADVYLLFALRRPDIWPMGDRALVVSMAESLSLDGVPSYEDAALIADQWRPWRSVAARMLWHAYLKNRGRSLT